jgi:restriction system protein
MPRYNCLKHNQIMEVRIVNDRIQPYCLECRIEKELNEALKSYTVNKEINLRKHKESLRKEYRENIWKSFGVTVQLILIFLFPGFIFGAVLNSTNLVSGVDLTYGVIAIIIVLAVFNFFKAVLNFPNHSTYYSEPTKEDIEATIKAHQNWELDEVHRFKEKLQKEYLIRSTRIEEVDQMDGFEFEQYVADLLRKIGFKNVEVTKKTGDGGVDILAIDLKGEKTAIQCKRQNSKVGFGAIQEIFMAKKRNKCKKAMVITNSYFTKPAFQVAIEERIELWTRERLMEEMRKVEPQFSLEEFVRSYYVLPEGKQRIS